jgi:hypothetical protein
VREEATADVAVESGEVAVAEMAVDGAVETVMQEGPHEVVPADRKSRRRLGINQTGWANSVEHP